MKKFFVFIFLITSLSKVYSQNGWTKKNNFPKGSMERAASFVIDDKGFCGLGTDNTNFRKDFWQYDPLNDKWDEIEKFPGDPRISAASFSINGKGYVGTGMIGSQAMQIGSNDFWEYNPEKNSWTQKANFGGAVRYAAIGFSIGDKGYIGLGINKNTNYSDIWEYNAAANKWSKKADFPSTGRSDACVFVVNNEAYMATGQGKELIPSQKEAWKFSPAKNEWKKIAPFPGPSRVGALAFGYRNRGFIACGFGGALKKYDDLWSYNPLDDVWEQKENVPFGTREYIFSFVIGNSAYICTGHAEKKTSGFEVWKFDFPKERYADRFALGGTLLLGENRIPLAAVNVKILNKNNEVVKTASSGLFGSFLFTDLLNNQEYTLKVDVPDPHMLRQKIYLVNRENELIAVLSPENNFAFKIAIEEKSKLQLLKIENKNMRMDMRGKLVLSGEKKIPFADVELSLIDDQQQVVQTAITDKTGHFNFNYLPADTNLYMTIDEQATSALPKGTTIMLMNDNDELVNKSLPSNSKMLLTPLPPEQNKLSKIYIEDPFVEATFGAPADGLVVVESIYFDVAKWDLLPDAKAVLNKVAIMMKSNKKISIELSAHTDSRGDSKSNIELSQKRADEAKKYIASQGVEAKRISAKGFGETKLLNKCTDGVDCTEEEHAKNRRMEFKIKYAK